MAKPVLGKPTRRRRGGVGGDLGSRTTVDYVVVGAAANRVVAPAAQECVVAARAVKGVVPAEAADDVSGRGTGGRIVFRGAGDGTDGDWLPVGVVV